MRHPSESSQAGSEIKPARAGYRRAILALIAVLALATLLHPGAASDPTAAAAAAPHVHELAGAAGADCPDAACHGSDHTLPGQPHGSACDLACGVSVPPVEPAQSWRLRAEVQVAGTAAISPDGSAHPQLRPPTLLRRV